MNERKQQHRHRSRGWMCPTSLSTPHRSLSHTHHRSFLSLCFSLCRHFKPDPKQIKKRIEDLIAREYLERDSNNNNVYKYLA